MSAARNFFEDLRFAARLHRKQPGFFLVTVLTLALGIGANSAIFSFVKAALVDALPYRDAGRLVMVWQDYRRHGGPEREWFSYPNFADYRSWNHTLVDLALFDSGTFTLATGGEPAAVAGELVTPAMFSVLGVRPLAGRGFLPEEANPGAPPVAMVSYSLWRDRFAGDPALVGKAIVLDDRPRTVVGILPEDFYAPLAAESAVFMPMTTPAPGTNGRTDLNVRAVGRLRPGVTLTAARADLSAVARRIEDEHADADRNVGASVFPLREEVMGKATPTLVVLLASVGFVVLIACVNVANFLLVRATARRGEIGLRTALGAPRARLIRQMLNEAVGLALCGGLVGTVLAVFAVALLKRLALSASFPLPHFQAVSVDWEVLAVTLVTSLATGLLFGLAPALQVRRADLTGVLKEGGGLGGGRATASRTGRLLVVFELALALVLMVGSGLMLRSLDRLQRVETGYDPAHLLVFQVDTPKSRYPQDTQVRSFYGELLNRLDGLPGVVSAGAVSSLPLGSANSDTSFRVEGQTDPDKKVKLWYRIVTPGYFRTVGLGLIAGRGIAAADQTGAPLAAVLNAAAAATYFPRQDPVGRVLLGSKSHFAVVGVVKNARTFSLRTAEPPAVYLSHGQVATRTMGIVVRARENPRQLTGPVRAIVVALDPAMAAVDLTTFDDVLTASLASERALAALMGTFGLLALALSALGLYGLMAYLTGQRTREIGIRMALGATTLSVRRMVVTQALALALASLVVGSLAAFALTVLLKSLLFETSALDPLTFAVSVVILLAIATLASYIPAWRASRLDPARILRS